MQVQVNASGYRDTHFRPSIDQEKTTNKVILFDNERRDWGGLYSSYPTIPKDFAEHTKDHMAKGNYPHAMISNGNIIRHQKY